MNRQFWYNNSMEEKRKSIEAYTTVRKSAECEFVEKKSRFIGICHPIENQEEAEEYLRACRERFPDATHVVFAWQTVLPERGGRFSDDGEPQGTAGMPTLDVLRKRGVDQAIILVVRYFGGIQLGAGGLVRAYSKAASMALDAAIPLEMVLRQRVRVIAPYEDFEKLRYQIAEAGFYQEEAEFGMDPEWVVSIQEEELPRLKELCAQFTAGAALLAREGIDYAPKL